MTLKLNLGCGDHIMPGYVNVDCYGDVDVRCDLAAPYASIESKQPWMTGRLGRWGWPWDESSVDEIVAHDIIEHLPNRIYTMNEMHRVLKPGAIAHIVVPTTNGRGAWQDPTHVSYWNRNSFWYFEAGNVQYRERFAASYGIRAAFRVVFESEEFYEDTQVSILTIDLAAVK